VEPPVHGIFEIPITVQAADIDRQNHVNNTVYVRWIQEVATAHWEARAPAEARDAIGWVVLRHEIDYKSPEDRRRHGLHRKRRPSVRIVFQQREQLVDGPPTSRADLPAGIIVSQTSCAIKISDLVGGKRGVITLDLQLVEFHPRLRAANMPLFPGFVLLLGT
jgi:hypothetical protein